MLRRHSGSNVMRAWLTAAPDAEEFSLTFDSIEAAPAAALAFSKNSTPIVWIESSIIAVILNPQVWNRATFSVLQRRIQ